ncbi:serine/threonine-protein phosphatase 4 regulatory subunit 1-like isoform X2 [Rhopilema esculentum]|uniref:serine/threonine-protein phosphatase 4 regulatory subunit 1-like isoform X2 n=1 Tax=Rhopilema esculentum TaxID=499914 RepID=UPI0031D73005
MRRCDTGEGMFVFKTKDGERIHQLVQSYAHQLAFDSSKCLSADDSDNDNCIFRPLPPVPNISSILPVYRSEDDDDQGDYDSNDYGGYYEPSILDQVNPDDLLSPVEKMKKYCISENIFTRQMVARNVVETMQTVTTEKDCHTVLQIIHHLSEDIEPSVRTELVEQLPSVCIVLSELQLSMDTVPKYILPIVVRFLTDQHNQVRKSSQGSLLQLMEHDLITRDDVEEQVCPVLLQLTEPDSGDDFRTEAVTLMTKITTLVGADITERLFLDRFGELCSDPLFHIRKECASNFGDISNVVGQEVTERALLKLFSRLCQDGVWGVRKSCAETFMVVSESCSTETRYEKLAPLFVNLLCDMSRWVQMAAYQALGQFISTFADPDIAGFRITEHGLEPCPKKIKRSKETIDHQFESAETRNQSSPVEEITQERSTTEESSEPTEKIDDESPIDSQASEDLSGNPSLNSKSAEDRLASDSNQESELYNSFLYWKSPVAEIVFDSEFLSLDETNSSKAHEIKPSLPELRVTDADKPTGVVNLSKQLSETMSDFDIEEEVSLNSSETLHESAMQDHQRLCSQTVIPPPLLEHYISMTEPTKAQTIDTELARHCAFTFPGAVLALGKENWQCLKDTYELLASDMQWKVRRTLAFSIHDLALVLGEEITVTDLIPIFNGFLKDLDEVRIGVLKHLYDFIKLLPGDLQKDYLPNFADFLNPDNNRNWRFRQELAEQLIMLSQLYEPREVIESIFPIAIALCGDKVADVRSSASRLLATILKQIRSSEEADQAHVKAFVNDVIKMGNRKQSWVKRKVCAQICQVLLNESAEDPGLFATDFLPSTIELAKDVVPNVRIVAAKTLSKFTETEFFRVKTEDDELYEVVMKALETLRGDDDQDVRYFAGAKSFEEVSLFSDDAMKNDGQSSEEYGDDSRQEGAESEEKCALVGNTSEDPLLTAFSYKDDCPNDEDEPDIDSCNISDEKLENDSEYVPEESQTTPHVQDEISSNEGSSEVIVEEVLENLIETIKIN